MEKVLESAEYEIFYRKIGSGNPVVLIHGFGEDGAIWEELIDNLKDRYEFLIPDLPGSGKSLMKAGRVKRFRELLCPHPHFKSSFTLRVMGVQ